jgi:hypothetical protein
MLQNGQGIVDDQIHDRREIQLRLQDRLAPFSIDGYRPLPAPLLRYRPGFSGPRLLGC